MCAAQLDFCCAGQQLGNDGGDDRAGRLTRPIRIKRPYNGHRGIETAIEAFCYPVCPNFSGGIGRLALEGMPLINGSISRRSINF